MSCRTAGYNVNLLEALDLILSDFHTGQVDLSILDNRVQSILHSFQLLMDLFHHEMLEPSLFCGFCIPFDFRGLLLDLVSIQVIEVSFSRSQLCKFQIANIIDIPGVLQNCRDISSFISYYSSGQVSRLHDT